MGVGMKSPEPGISLPILLGNTAESLSQEYSDIMKQLNAKRPYLRYYMALHSLKSEEQLDADDKLRQLKEDIKLLEDSRREVMKRLCTEAKKCRHREASPNTSKLYASAPHYEVPLPVEPLPLEVVISLNQMLEKLTCAKQSVYGVARWILEKPGLLPRFADPLSDRAFSVKDTDGLLAIIFLVTELLYESLLRRNNPTRVDEAAQAFKTILGPILSRIYDNPHKQQTNRIWLEKVVDFWNSHGIFDEHTIISLEREMRGGRQAEFSKSFQEG